MMTSATLIHNDMIELIKKFDWFDAAVETKAVSHSKRKGSIRALLDDLVSEKKNCRKCQKLNTLPVLCLVGLSLSYSNLPIHRECI